jgi:hypothetical protein
MCRASFYYSRNSTPLGHCRGLSSNSRPRLQLSWMLPTSFVQLEDAVASQLDAPDFFRPTRGRHLNSVGYSQHLSSNSRTRLQLSWMLPTSFVQLEDAIATQLDAPDFFRPTRGRGCNSVGYSQLLSSNSRTRSHLSWMLPTSFVQLEAAVATQLDAPDTFRPTRGRHCNSVGCSRHLPSNSRTRLQLSWMLPTPFVQLEDAVATQLDAPDFFRPTRGRGCNSVGCSQLLSSNSRTPSQLSWMLPTSFVQLEAAITTQLATPDIFRPTREQDHTPVGYSQLLSSNSRTRSHSSWMLPTSFVQLEDAIATQLATPNFFRPTRGHGRISVGCSRLLSSNSRPRLQLSWMLPTPFVQLEDAIATQLDAPDTFRPTRGRGCNSVGCSRHLPTNSMPRSFFIQSLKLHWLFEISN